MEITVPTTDRLTLGSVMASPSEHDGCLFIEPGPWTAASRCTFVVFDKDADPDDDPVPQWVTDLDWEETIDVNTIEEIVFNATAQLGKPSVDQLVEAFSFYVDRDAFKVFR